MDDDLPPPLTLRRRQSSGIALVSMKAGDLASDDVSSSLLALLAANALAGPVRAYRKKRAQLGFVFGVLVAVAVLLHGLNVRVYLTNLLHGPYTLSSTELAGFGARGKGYEQQDKRWVVAELGKRMDQVGTSKVDRGVYKFLQANAMATSDDEVFGKVRVHDDHLLLVRYPGPSHPLLQRLPPGLNVSALHTSSLRCLVFHTEHGIDPNPPQIEDLKQWPRDQLVTSVEMRLAEDQGAYRLHYRVLPLCGILTGFLTDFPLDFQPPGYLPLMLDAEDPYKHTLTDGLVVVALYLLLRTVYLAATTWLAWRRLVQDDQVKITPALRRELRFLLSLATGQERYRWERQPASVYHDVLAWLFDQLRQARGGRRLGHKSGVFVLSLDTLDAPALLPDYAPARPGDGELARHALVLVDDTMLATYRQWKAMRFGDSAVSNASSSYHKVHTELIRQLLASETTTFASSGTRVASGHVLPVRVFPLEAVCMVQDNEVFFVNERFPGMSTTKDALSGLRKVALSLRNLSIRSDFPTHAEQDEEVEVTKLVQQWVKAALKRFDPGFETRFKQCRETFLRIEEEEARRLEEEQAEKAEIAMAQAEEATVTERLATSILQGNIEDVFNEHPSDPRTIVRIIRSAKPLTENSPELAIGEDGQPEECPVCMGFYELHDLVVRLPCPAGHKFHAECARSWLERHNQCPLCRAEVAQEMKIDEGNILRFMIRAIIGGGTTAEGEGEEVAQHGEEALPALE